MGNTAVYVRTTAQIYSKPKKDHTWQSHLPVIYPVNPTQHSHTLEKHISFPHVTEVYGEICLTAVVAHNAMIYHDNTVAIHI